MSFDKFESRIDGGHETGDEAVVQGLGTLTMGASTEIVATSDVKFETLFLSDTLPDQLALPDVQENHSSGQTVLI